MWFHFVNWCVKDYIFKIVTTCSSLTITCTLEHLSTSLIISYLIGTMTTQSIHSYNNTSKNSILELIHHITSRIKNNTDYILELLHCWLHLGTITMLITSWNYYMADYILELPLLHFGSDTLYIFFSLPFLTPRVIDWPQTPRDREQKLCTWFCQCSSFLKQHTTPFMFVSFF